MGTIDHSVAPTQGGGLSGNVHGGQQPVSGSVIQLWIAGTSGYGTGAVSALNSGTSVVTDAGGNFNITGDYTCADTDQVYITATGGNPGVSGNRTNAAIGLMTALGSCGQLKANAATEFISINEVSTIASAYALAQFATPNAGGTGIQVGTTSGNITGLANAMKTVNNLFDLSSGFARSITPFYAALGGTPGGLLNSSYVPQARINTLANVLASCINTVATGGSVDGSGVSGQCSSLFTAVTPTGATAPVDTMQAALAIAQNPGHNVATIFGLAGGIGAPFQPALGSPAPTDWTLALTYEGGGMGLQPGKDPVAATVAGAMAIDEQGNIWIAGGCPGASVTAQTPGLFELDNQGNGISPASTSTTCGGFSTSFNGSPTFTATTPVLGIAEDLNQTMWLTGYGALVPFSNTGAAKHAAYKTVYPSQCGTGQPYFGVTVDISNNLWVTCDGGAGYGSGAVMSSVDGTTIGGMYGGNTDFSSTTFDLSGNFWMVQEPTYGNPSQDADLFQVSPTINSSQYYPQTSDSSASGQTFHNSVAVDGLGNVYSPSLTPGVLVKMAPPSSGTGAYTASQFQYPALTGSAAMQQVVVDGNNRIWGVSFTGMTSAIGSRTQNATAPTHLIELGSDGTLLSPSGANPAGGTIYGFTGTGGGSETETILSNSVAITEHNTGSVTISGLAIDGSGNLWVSNAGMASPVYNSLPAVVPPTEQIVEFIGVAGPVRTPIVQALSNGEIGVLPQAVRGRKVPVIK